MESIPVVDANVRSTFRLRPNRPVVLRAPADVAAWPLARAWAAGGRVQWAAVRADAGHLRAPAVADGSAPLFSDHARAPMLVAEFVDAVAVSEPPRPLYLKDWHLVRDAAAAGGLGPDAIGARGPGLGVPLYDVPHEFADDWLNRWCDARGAADDFRFVYLGPGGSWTPLHTDVYGSFSWSANLAGVKRWLFFPPEARAALLDSHGRLMYDWTGAHGDAAYGYKRVFPNAAAVRPIELRQQPGDIVFVPSGWLHQVFNETDALSVNHNWANASNVEHMARELHAARAEVERELADLRGIVEEDAWVVCVEDTLRAHHGWNCADFADYLAFNMSALGVGLVPERRDLPALLDAFRASGLALM